MPDYTNFLGLYKPSRNDNLAVDTTLADNFSNIDSKLGSGLTDSNGTTYATLKERLGIIDELNDNDDVGVVLDAVGDGVTDNTQSLKDAIIELKRIGGGRLFINAGDYRISEPILFDLSGVDILGVPILSTFSPTDDFIGDDLFIFSNGFDTAISGINIEGIKIDMRGIVGNGLTVVNGYQFVTMKNVSVIEVSPSSTALNFTYNTTHGIAGQTILLENVYGIKSGAGNTSPTLFMERYQEVVFSGVKMFGSKFDSGASSDGTAFHFKDCRGIVLYGCSQAFGDTGILWDSATRSGQGLTVSGMTSENILGYSLYVKSTNDLPASYINYLPSRHQGAGGSFRIENTQLSTFHVGTSETLVRTGSMRNTIYSQLQGNVTIPDDGTNVVFYTPSYGYEKYGIQSDVEVISASDPTLSLKVDGQDKEMRVKYVASGTTDSGFVIERKIQGIWKEQLKMVQNNATFFDENGDELGRFYGSSAPGYTNFGLRKAGDTTVSRVRYDGIDSGGSGARMLTIVN